MAGVGFSALDILQPAIVLGWPREMRAADLVKRAVMPLVNPFLTGAREAQRGIPMATAAAAMLGTLRSGRRGPQRYTYCGDMRACGAEAAKACHGRIGGSPEGVKAASGAARGPSYITYHAPRST